MHPLDQSQAFKRAPAGSHGREQASRLAMHSRSRARIAWRPRGSPLAAQCDSAIVVPRSSLRPGFSRTFLYRVSTRRTKRV